MTAALDHWLDGGRLVLRPAGSWVIEAAMEIERALKGVGPAPARDEVRTLEIDGAGLADLDTAGAFLLARLERDWGRAGRPVRWSGIDPARATLLERVRATLADDVPAVQAARRNALDRIGAAAIGVGADMSSLVQVLGAVVREFAGVLVRPSQFRAAAVVRQMELAGLNAVPIIALMSLLIGGIIAQQGAFQLQFFGAAIFTVDLVGILSLREVAPLLTAIMVAGRSGSAITAELGSMRMREEIDALRVMGLDPVNVLVLPRVIALILILPLLSFIAAMATLLGAMVTLWLYVDIPPAVYLSRLQEAVDLGSLLSGLIKAPFMALIIGLIACTEGMAVRGSAESLGRHTTAAVVKAIFMVIVVDGVFAVFYGAIGF